MEYDHDNIAKNHENPQVAFMVASERAERKHFDKNSYDAAQKHQLSYLSRKDFTGVIDENGEPLPEYIPQTQITLHHNNKQQTTTFSLKDNHKSERQNLHDTDSENNQQSTILTRNDDNQPTQLNLFSDESFFDVEAVDKQQEGGTQIATVAPYFRQQLNSQNIEELKQKTEEIKGKAQKLASEIGVEISSIHTMGGTYQGKSEISYMYELKNATPEQADLFASLMGDLSFEFQDAVIAANYITKEEAERTGNSAIELVFTAPKNITIESIEESLKEAGIEGSSYKFDSNELIIMAFSKDEYTQILTTLTQEKYGYKYKESNSQNSRYLDTGSRRDTYKAWLNSEMGQQNRSLYNACSKALEICNAAIESDRRTEGQDESVRDKLRKEAADKAAQQWDEEHNAKESSAKDILPETASQETVAEQKAIEKQQAEDETFLEKQNKLVAQLNALTDSSLLTSSEVRDIAEQVVYAVLPFTIGCFIPQNHLS